MTISGGQERGAGKGGSKGGRKGGRSGGLERGDQLLGIEDAVYQLLGIEDAVILALLPMQCPPIDLSDCNMTTMSYNLVI